MVGAGGMRMTCPKCKQLFVARKESDRARAAAAGPMPRPVVGAAPWPEGTLLAGEWRVEGVLGEGGMGTVYLVCEEATRRRYAAKRVLAQYVTDEERRRAFIRELGTWIGIEDHPNVAACRFFRTIDEEIVIFAELVEGGSLAHWIRDERIRDLGVALDIAIQFAWGLDAAHRQGLVHRDVKPANVLMTTEGIPKVTDFGLAEMRGAEKAGAIGGMTREYCSPEQAAGHPLTPATDVWSWGVSVLEMFMGGRSWMSGLAASEVLADFVIDPDVLPPFAMPPAVVQVLRRCFQPRAQDRWSTLGQAADALMVEYHRVEGAAYPRHNVIRTRALAGAAVSSVGLDWLRRALASDGRDPSAADLLVPQLGGGDSRRAEVAELAAFEEAARIYTRLAEAPRADEDVELGELLMEKSRCHLRAGDFPGAISQLDRAFAHFNRLIEQGQTARFAELGKVLLWRARITALRYPRDAVKTYDAVIDAIKLFVDRGGFLEPIGVLARCFREKATAMHELGDASAALPIFELAIQAARFAGVWVDPAELPLALAGKARALTTQLNPRAALQIAAEAFQIADQRMKEKHDLRAASARAAMAMAEASAALSEPDHPALRGYDIAIAMLEQVTQEPTGRDHQRDLAQALCCKADWLRVRGDGAGALALVERATGMVDDLVEKQGRAELTLALIDLLARQIDVRDAAGDLAATVPLHDRAIELYARVQKWGGASLAADVGWHHAAKADALLLGGKLRESIGAYDAAIAACEQAMRDGASDQLSRLANCLTNVGHAHTQLGDARSAERAFERARSLSTMRDGRGP